MQYSREYILAKIAKAKKANKERLIGFLLCIFIGLIFFVWDNSLNASWFTLMSGVWILMVFGVYILFFGILFSMVRLLYWKYKLSRASK